MTGKFASTFWTFPQGILETWVHQLTQDLNKLLL